jgi:hypothetical protein
LAELHPDSSGSEDDRLGMRGTMRSVDKNGRLNGTSKSAKKIATPEMVKNLTVDQLYDLQMQGWEHENPVKDCRELMPKMEKSDEQKTFSEAWALKESRRRPANATLWRMIRSFRT